MGNSQLSPTFNARNFELIFFTLSILYICWLIYRTQGEARTRTSALGGVLALGTPCLTTCVGIWLNGSNPYWFLTLLRSSRLNTRDLHYCRVCRNHSHSLSLGLPSYCRSPLALMGSWQLGYLSVIAHRSTCHIDLCGSFSGFSVRQGTLLWCPFGL